MHSLGRNDFLIFHTYNKHPIIELNLSVDKDTMIFIENLLIPAEIS